MRLFGLSKLSAVLPLVETKLSWEQGDKVRKWRKKEPHYFGLESEISTGTNDFIHVHTHQV